MLLRKKSTQIKEHPSWEASINTNFVSMDSFTPVYTRLHSSTLVHIRLDSSTVV